MSAREEAGAKIRGLSELYRLRDEGLHVDSPIHDLEEDLFAAVEDAIDEELKTKAVKNGGKRRDRRVHEGAARLVPRT